MSRMYSKDDRVTIMRPHPLAGRVGRVVTYNENNWELLLRLDHDPSHLVRIH